MRSSAFVIAIGLLLPPGLIAQGIDPGTTRQLTAVSEMGHAPVQPERLPRALTFEEGDDPTVGAHSVAMHEPPPAARKAAEKADRLAKQKRRSRAIAKYRAAVAIDPLYFQAWNNLALELEGAGQTREAGQILRRLVESNPEHVVAFTNLANLLSDQHRYAEAEAVARQAMKLHTHSYSANYVLGTVLINEDKWSDEARASLEYAQLKYPMAKAMVDRWPKSP